MAVQRSLVGCWVLALALLGTVLRVKGDVTLTASATHSHPMEGHTTQLICEVQSMNQSQVIVWSKDQMSITWGDAMGQMMSPRFALGMTSMGGGRTTYNLTIRNISRDDDGRYQCQVLEVTGNGYSAMASDTVVLSVLYFPSKAFPRCSLNGSQTFLSGTELRVACSTESGNPQVTTRWLVSAGGPVAQPRFVTAEDSSMVVSELELVVTPDLQGLTYVCQVTSPVFVGRELSCSLGPLRVLDWPVVRVARSVSRSPRGTDVHFTCHVEPAMPGVEWATGPDLDPSRLVWSDEGSVLTVKNLRASDNGTEVICRAPFQDTFVEARSVILLAGDAEGDWIYPVAPDFGITSELCVPWFAAFLFAVAVNFILCMLIVRLLFRNRQLGAKLSGGKSRPTSLRDVEGETLAARRKSTLLTWPSGSLNWTTNVPSQSQLRDQRNMSWQHLPPTGDGEASPEAPSPQTYTELSPETMDGKVRAQRKRTRRAVSMPRMGTTDSDSYVTPDPIPAGKPSRPPQKAGSEAVATGRRAGQLPAAGRPRKANTVETVSGRVSISAGQSQSSPPVPDVADEATEVDSYMPLDESQLEAPERTPSRSTYQSLQRAANNTPARSTSRQASATSLQKKLSAVKRPDADDMDDEMMGNSGTYSTGGPARQPATRESSSAKSRQGSMAGESATYMPAGSLANHQASTSAKSPIYSAGVTEDGMGDPIYASSVKHSSRIQKQRPAGSSSSRGAATAPDPAGGRLAKGRPSEAGDSDKSPLSSPTYFTLERPDQGEYNYGADISSESDSYQAGTCDWGPGGRAESARRPPDTGKGLAPATQPSSASDTSYLELEDPEGEIKGYMDMTKKTAAQPAKAPPKPAASTAPSRRDADLSSGEEYQQMEGVSAEYEYSIPPASSTSRLQPVAEESASGPPNRSGQNPSKKKSARHQPKRKNAWSFPKW